MGHSSVVVGAPKLVVSLHDVHPGSVALFRDCLGELAGIGVDRTSLLVVPRWHGTGTWTGREDAWLRTMADGPHEVCLHGYDHLDGRRATGTVLQRWVANRYTAGEGEFYRIEPDDARVRIRDGLKELQVRGLTPTGFVAPAWLLNPAVLPVLREAGFRYTTYWSGIRNLDAGAWTDAPVLVASARSAWRRVCSRVWLRLFERVCARREVLRIAIHPDDWVHPALRRQFLALAAGAIRAGRVPVTYGELCASTPTPDVPPPALDPVRG